jgi:dephospho-CoA kinase
MARLVQKRKMTEEAARQRINAQPPQEEKLAAANIVIRNTGSFEDAWRQVAQAWATLFPGEEAGLAPPAKVARGEMVIERARPRQANEIAAFITRLSGNQRKMTREDVMAAFGEKAFLLLRMDRQLVGLAGWQVENLVARTDDIFLEPEIALPAALRLIMGEVERTSRDLQCEVSLLFLPVNMAQQEHLWRGLGYELRSLQSLGVRAWQEAAQESMPPGTVLLFKQLRKDRVLRPV